MTPPLPQVRPRTGGQSLLRRRNSAGALYHAAAASGDLATLACLRRLGLPWDPEGSAFTGVIEGCGCLEVVRWLHAAGCPVDWRQAWKAVRLRTQAPWQARHRARTEILAWVEEQMRAAGIPTEPDAIVGARDAADDDDDEDD